MNINVGSNEGIFRKFEATNAPKGEGLAKEMMIFADKNAAAVSEEEFQNMLKKMKKLSPRELVNFIRSFDKKESIIELICDEIGNGKKSRRKACEDVFKALLSQAEKLGIETDGFSKEIKDELDAQFTGAAKYVNTKKLDSILYALTQAIENRQDLTAEDMEAIQNTSAEDAHNTTTAIMDGQLQGAYAAFGERIDENGEWTNRDENGELLNGQLQQDGWAGDVADFVSKIWNNELYGNEHGNTADLVRKDLRAYHDQLQELQAASAEGEEAFAAKFKEIFGVDYEYKNIVAYQKVEQEYVTASLFNAMETQFNRGFRTLLSKAPLREEYETTVMNSSAGAVSQSVLSATKEQVYEREFANLASFFGEDGESTLNSRIAQAGLENATIDEKFEVLKQIASEISTNYHNLATAACDGKDFATVEAKFENSYKAAFGVENDIMERVSKYNRSQQTGAMAVKLTAVIGASFAGGYIGGAMAASAATAAAAAGTTAAFSASTATTLGGAIGASAMTFLTEAADDLTTTKALEAWAKGDLKTLNECVDWSGIVKQAATSGIMMVGFGAVAKGVQVLTVGLSPAAQGAAMFGANMAFGTGAEYVMTGKVSIQGVVLTGVFSLVAGVLQFHAANVTKAAEDAIKAQLQQDIANARSVLGIDDSVEITAELLKSMKKDFALQLHPDKFGGQVPTTATGHTMGDINAALDVLNRNLAGTYVDVNAGVAAAKAAASADDATMALTTTQTVDSGLEKAILSFARSAGVDKQVVASTISKHPDAVNALVSSVAPDGTPMFTNKDIAQILGSSANMLEKDKAMFMAVLNSEREMSIVASHDNKAYAFWKATVDPLNETYYAVRGGKSAQASAAQNPLAEAGFTDDVIAAMKADAGEFYGVELVDEALKTVEYLEKQVADGAKITRELVEEAIMTCHPGSSGSSTSVVRSWIANNWRYGDEVYNAYGQRAPGQSVLSKGNIKAKYNKVKHSIKETIEDIKFELGIDDAPKVESTSKGQQTSSARSEATTTSTVQPPGHASNEVIEQFTAARSTDDLARLVRNTSNVDDLEFIIRKLQSQDHVVNKQVIESITEDAINKRSILQGGPKEVEVSKGAGSYLKVYDDSGNLVSITRRSGSEVLSHIEYDAQGQMIEAYSLVEDGAVAATPTPSVAPAKPAKPAMIRPCELPKGMRHHDGNIGNVSVSVASGDITTIKADAYLVPEFKMGASDAGVGGAIWSRGAGKGMEAYNNIIKTQGEQEFGSVHVTESGGGNSSKLIHAVTVNSGAENEFAVVQKAVYNALKAAEKQGLTSIAIPQVGTGIIGRLTDEQSAQAIMSAIKQFSDEGGQMDVSLVIYGNQRAYNTFSTKLDNGSYANAGAVSTVGGRELNSGRIIMGMSNGGIDVAVQAEAAAEFTPHAVEAKTPSFESLALPDEPVLSASYVKPTTGQPRFDIEKVKADVSASFDKAGVYHGSVDKALTTLENLGLDAKSSEVFVGLAKEHPKAMAEVLTYFDDPVKTANAFNKIMDLAENNLEECSKVLQDIRIRLNEIDYRRHTWNVYGLARSEGYNAYSKMHDEIARLKTIMEDLAK